ncbi:MAG: bacterial transcriptional activator domain-containing protein [Dehalococcoidia bacterium]
MEAIGLDPFRERSYQLLMESYAASGNRSEAIKTYHTLHERLADELGTDPSPEIEAIYLELLK